MTKGNGVFKWWMALYEDDEHYHGPYDTREEVISAGILEFGDDEDNGRFHIMECDKSVVVYGGIDEDDLALTIGESIAEANEMCWGEDGWDGAWSEAQTKALGQALKFTIAGWLQDNPARTWSVGQTRQYEAIDIKAAKAAQPAAE